MNQKLTPIQVEDYYAFNFLVDAAVSPDGTKIAYVVESYSDKSTPQIPIRHSSLQVSKNDFSSTVSSFPLEVSKIKRSNIWIYDVIAKSSCQLTCGELNISPSFSPDSNQLSFVSNRKVIPQLFLIDLDGGEARQLTSISQGVFTKAEWSSDGKRLTFAANPKKINPRTAPYRISRKLYRYDGWGLVDDFKADIFVLDLAVDPHTITQRTDDGAHHWDPKWSPDGTKIMCLKNFTHDGDLHAFPQLEILEEDCIQTPMDGWGSTMKTAWISNTRICFVGDAIDPNYPVGSKKDLFVYDMERNQFYNRTLEFLYQTGGGIEIDMPWLTPTPIIISNDEDFALVSVQAGGNVTIYKIALSGEESCEEIVGGNRVNHIRNKINDTIIYISSHQNNPYDLHALNLDSKSDEQLTQLNQTFLSTKSLPTVENIHFFGSDGVPVEGWFWKPSIGKAPFPTILKIHGGPHGAIGNVFDFDSQFLCGAGYAVLSVNQRASTGYGNAFGTAIKGDWGNLDYHDLMAGVDKAIELNLADSDRLGCCGISAGGNLTCWIIGQTQRFKAAIPENPITNFQSYYGTSDVGSWYAREELGGMPHEIPEIYRRCSPITNAHKCTTPTLLIQHDNDLRCPPEQSEQFYTVLRDVGCEVEMLRMPGSPHSGSAIGPLEIREAQNRAYLEWFGKYIPIIE